MKPHDDGTVEKVELKLRECRGTLLRETGGVHGHGRAVPWHIARTGGCCRQCRPRSSNLGRVLLAVAGQVRSVGLSFPSLSRKHQLLFGEVEGALVLVDTARRHWATH